MARPDIFPTPIPYSFRDFFLAGEVRPIIYEKGESPQMDFNRLTKISYGTNATIEDLIIAQAYFQVVADRIKANGHEVPENLDNVLTEVTCDLNCRIKANKERELKTLELRLETLLTQDEKRAKVTNEIAKLKAELGK